MPMHKTSAWPLALVYFGLIVYASLYPFTDWRDQGVAPWSFLVAPLPRYWTGFDVLSNVLGYMPLGFLLALGALRTGRDNLALVVALLAGALLSLSMESFQVYLPARVSSNLDLLLNVLGSMLGAGVAWSLLRLGLLQRWNRFRGSWFIEEARGGIVLLALWPMALLFPSEIAFGLGQVVTHLEGRLKLLFEGKAWLEWLPGSELELQFLSALAQWWCVVLGMVIPGLLGFCVIPKMGKRVWLLVWLGVLGVAATTLSASLSFGPQHAWDWLVSANRSALLFALLVLLGLVWVPTRAAAALALLALGVNLSVINQAAVSPYFEQTLFLWEQGRFIRFHGLALWLGWLWPYATVVYVLGILWRRDVKN
jgi:VanZ family protein